MSVKMMSWAWDRTEVKGSDKLLLMALADHADDEGLCWPGQEALAQKCGITSRAIRDALVRLHKLGLIDREHRQRSNGSRTSDLIRLIRAPEESSGRTPVQPEAERRSNRKPASAPEPSEEPSGHPPIPPQGLFASTESHLRLVDDLSPYPAKPKGSYLRKPITDSEWVRACKVMEAWKEVGSEALGRAPHVCADDRKHVVKVLREFPDVTVDDHREVIEAVFSRTDGWWKGTPSPGVVYGGQGASLFARALDESAGHRDERRRARALEAAKREALGL